MRVQLKPSSLLQTSIPDGPRAAAGNQRRNRRGEAGFIGSFLEVLVSVIIVAVVFGSIINGYLSTAIRSQWSAYSLAAQSLGLQTIEQAKSCVWDGLSVGGKNELLSLSLLNSNWNASTMTYTGYTTNILDVPWKGTNYVLATNFITIRTVYFNNVTNMPVQLQIIRVDTVWPFTDWGNFQLQYYTNSVATFIAPDNRDPSTLGVDNN